VMSKLNSIWPRFLGEVRREVRMWEVGREVLVE